MLLHSTWALKAVPAKQLEMVDPLAHITRKFGKVGHATSLDHPAWLHECKQIYFDTGSNIGVQIRKLYEPSKYPGALVLSLFDRVFGNVSHRSLPASTTGLCALGMEPNPNHQERLAAVEAAYLKKGWNVHFYPFAAAFEDGIAEFEVNDSSTHEDWGAGLDGGDHKGNRQVNVTTVDFGRFIQSLPKGSIVLMKMDIEGGEYDALASMSRHQVACREWVPRMFIEVHGFGSLDHWQGTMSYDSVVSFLTSQATCRDAPIEIEKMDDESYLHDDTPLSKKIK